jgi:hypothetical protein
MLLNSRFPLLVHRSGIARGGEDADASGQSRPVLHCGARDEVGYETCCLRGVRLERKMA